MKETFPSFDLGIDHLFPSEPEERRQKKEERATALVSNLDDLVEGAQSKTTKYATKYAVNVFKVIFAFNCYNEILKITYCFLKKCTIKLNANSMLQSANVLKSNFMHLLMLSRWGGGRPGIGGGFDSSHRPVVETFDRFNGLSSNIVLTFSCYFDDPQMPCGYATTENVFYCIKSHLAREKRIPY